MAENTYRSFEGEIRLMERDNEFLYDVEIWLINDAVNRNGWQYEGIETNKDLFCGIPILCAYVGKRIGDGHTFTMVKDPQTGEEYASFMDAKAERIVGSLSEKPEDMRVEERDGKKWVVGKGFLWAWYARELVEKIETYKEQGKAIEISIETLVSKSHMEGEVEVEEEYKILGVTLLGDGIAPAVEDARILALQEITSEFEELKLRAASYINKPDGEGKKKEPEGGTTIKPQNNTTKGVNTLKAFSKKQLAELAPKFEGYKVLAAAKDENGIYVCLMSENGVAATYTMGSIDETIAPEKILRTDTQIQFEFGEDCAVAVDTFEVLDSFIEEAIKANTALEGKGKELEEAEQTIRTMTENELKRRVSAAKAKALSTLEKFNANREEKVTKDVLSKVNESIEAGEFSECEDESGCWAGEEKVEEAVLAACAAQVMEMDKASAARSRTDYIWNNIGSHNAPEGGIGALLSSYGIK